MDNARFNKLCAELDRLCDATFGDRRAAYSEIHDRLSNFKEISQLTGIPIHSVCAVLMGKHIIALNKALKEGYLHTPRLLEYIIDIINYHKLLWGIINEDQPILGSVLSESCGSGCNEQQVPQPEDRGNPREEPSGHYHGLQRPGKRTPSLL